MNELKERSNVIYEIRNKQVILDRDLAHLLQMETRILNQTVKRNMKYFSEECFFQMAEEEFMNWKSQVVISNQDKIGLRRSPYVFTELGVRILESILRFKINIDWNSNNEIYNLNKIDKMIYEIRGKKVMLDSDLAQLYECKNGTKEMNQAVKNNLEKFPERFSWLLNDDDVQNLRSKFLTSSLEERYGGRRYAVRVFTEQGVAMLSTVLKSKVATQVSIEIMDAFVIMRKYVSDNLIEQKYIHNQVMKHTEDIKFLQESFSKLEEKKKVNEIYFEGQIYSAYSKLLDIMIEAKK